MPTCTELTTEQLESLSQIQDIAFPTTPLGIALANQGCDKEAFRLERCGKIRIRRCPNGHVDRRMKNNCELRFSCPDCLKRNARERFEAWEPQLKYAMKALANHAITLIDIFQPLPRTKQALNGFIKTISKTLIREWQGETPLHWIVPVQFCGDHLKVRVLIIHPFAHMIPEPLPDWNNLWPGAKVSHRTHPIYRLLHVFEHDLLAPVRIADPNDCAEQEIIFKGVHRLRAVGVKTSSYKTIEDESEDISVEDTDSTEKSTRKKHAHDCCTTCGLKFVAESTDLHSHAATLNEIKWRPLPEN
jgi:hypothetical protein